MIQPGQTKPKKTNLTLALLCLVLAAVAGLTDVQLATHWAELNAVLAALPALQGYAMAAAVFGWFLALPVLALAAYACVGGNPTRAARNVLDAGIRRLGGSSSSKEK